MSFVGRASEEDAIDRLFAGGARLVTLIGPGGMGKTSLAKRYAARVSEQPGHDCYFADLTEARSLDAVLGAVGSAAGLALAEAASAEAAVEQLRHALASRPEALVILDNVEGREAAVSTALDAWLSAGDGPRYLLTSRVKLGRRDERCVDVGPLAPEHAVRLFEDRARRFIPDFVADASTRELVIRLDGNPLAIELAAARAHVLAPAALLARFSRHLDLVRSAGAAVAPRHASLRAVVGASWDLCSDDEQRVLGVFTAFHGGFGLEAAEHVLSRLGLGEASDRIESLLAQSMLRRLSISTPRGHRYALYESVREYASERLTLWADLAPAVPGAHAAYYLGLAAVEGPQASSGVPSAIDALMAEADNLFAAFQVEPRHAVALDAVFAARLTRTAHQDLLSRALSKTEGMVDPSLSAELHLARAMARGRGDTPTTTLEDADEAVRRASACGRADLEAHARLMRTLALGDSEGLIRARDAASETVAFARRHRTVAVLAKALVRLGWSALHAGDVASVERCAEEALAIATGERLLGVQAVAHNLLGALDARRGALERAEQHFRLGVDAARASRSWGDETTLLGNLARLATQIGDARRARAYLEQGLAQARLGGFRRAEGVQLAHLATLLVGEGHLVEARTCAAQAARMLSEVGYRRYESAARYTLGCIALEEGRLESAEEALRRCEAAGVALGDASLTGPARAALAVVLARAGDLDAARAMLRSARDFLDDDAPRELAVLVAAREGLVDVEVARLARSEGRVGEAAAASARAARSLEAARSAESGSHDLRVAGRMLAAACESLMGSAAPAGLEPRPATAPSAGRFELVTRSGIRGFDGQLDASEFDLYFDALRSSVVVDGTRTSDLRRKPIAARLLTVLLREPARRFDKAALFEQVWHAKYRLSSQGATLYKAVDRLTRLLDRDPRRFFRWDEEGCLVVVAARPGLSRVREAPGTRSEG